FLIVDYYLSLGVLGALLIGSSAKAQRLGDLTAHTTVVRIKQDLHFTLSDILKINTIENYTPKFPEVKSLGEKDMLLLKQTLGRYQAHPNSSHKEAILLLYDKMVDILGVDHNGRDKIGFLKTLLRDYIVLTR
ncbi:MAG: RDD family protein, partial [Saprospiraceae bacterium]|nr:RDD family protein [Saprospiraceae bacterium]